MRILTLPEKGDTAEKPPTRKEQYGKCTMDIVNGMLLPQQKRDVSSTA
jgi:hypothetical protein